MPTYYFAYGSNMSARQMAQRCPGAKPMGVARLKGWRYIINTIGAAALKEDLKSETYGVLWQCTARHMADLDRYEGVKQQVYARVPQRFELLPLGHSVNGIAYIALDQRIGAAPVPGYMENAILPGAREFMLPKQHIAQLETWLPGGSSYADPNVRRKSTFRYGLKKTRKFTGWGGQK